MPYVRRTPAPTHRLAELLEARAKADRDVTQEVARLKHAGVSWLDIAEVMSTQRQNAHRRYQNLDKTLYTARVQRTVFGWIVSVAGVPAAVFHYPHDERPSDQWVHDELAVVLDRMPQSFNLHVDFDYEGLAP